VRRRDFLAAAAAGFLWPPGGAWRPRRRAPAEWAFRLDDRLRWSLVARSGSAAVADAEIAVRLAGSDAVPLAELEDLHRIRLWPPTGGSTGWQVVGTRSGVEVSALFLDGPPPRIAVTVRGLGGERALDEIVLLDTRSARVAALAAAGERAEPPRLLVNGYASTSECRLVSPGDAELVGHWQTAILPRTRAPGLALAFGSDDAAAGRFAVADGLVASAAFAARPVGMALVPATASLAVVPGPDPLGALGRLSATVDTAPAAPCGWTSGGAPGETTTEDALLAVLDAARSRFDAEAFRLIELGEGYQRSAGDWETNQRFPHGHRWLTDRIHAAGFKAGLWLAPFAVAERSGIPAAHPEWLLQSPDGQPLAVTGRDGWGGAVYGLDAGLAPVRDYLRDLARHAVTDWGYDHLSLDALEIGAAGTRAGRRVGPAEAYRAGLRALREGADGAFVVGSGPLQHAAGLVDAMRTTAGAGPAFAGTAPAARDASLRAHLNGAAWINDAGTVRAGDPLTLEEARTWASVVALSGDLALAAGPLDALPEERLAVLRRVMPLAPVRGRPLDAAADGSGHAADGAPAWLLAAVQDGWWMLAAVNWEDEPRELRLALADHGLRGPLAAYDVWRDARLADLGARLALSLGPHACTVLSLRRPRRAPFVLGSTRHVVQGLLDLEDERWDGRRRVLSARSTLLDGRPYAVTVAVPRGFEAGEVRADPDTDVALETADGGAVRLVFPAPPREGVDWEIAF